VANQDPFGFQPEQWGDRKLDASGMPCEPDAPSSPNYALWLFYLYLRPRKFFRDFVVEHLWFTTIVASLLFGISSAIGRVETRASVSSSPAANWVTQSWGNYAAVVLATGIFGAALYYVLGGWWYRVRLKWSGARQPDKVLARRVYVYSSTVHALPAVLLTVWEAATYPTPMDAINSGATVWTLGLSLFLLWSVVVSYVGVRTVFEVRGVRPVIWFLVLPGMVYGLIAIGAFVVWLFGTPAPQVSKPIQYDSGHIEMTLPGDWEVDTAVPEFDAARYLPIVMPQSAAMEVYVELANVTPRELADAAIDSLQASNPPIKPVEHFTRWGAMDGVGRELTYGSKFLPEVVRVFATQVSDDDIVVVYEWYFEEDETTLRPGFDLIANSLRLKKSAASP